ncbi:MAG: hypothetical protein ACJ0Q7_04965 [Pelagibacteraceae bacterium]
MINFDNSFFFNKSGLNYSKSKNYNKNLELAQKNSEEMLKEFKSGKNQILQSFTSEYQKKIRDLKQDLGLKNKKKL